MIDRLPEVFGLHRVAAEQARREMFFEHLGHGQLAAGAGPRRPSRGVPARWSGSSRAQFWLADCEGFVTSASTFSIFRFRGKLRSAAQLHVGAPVASRDSRKSRRCMMRVSGMMEVAVRST